MTEQGPTDGQLFEGDLITEGLDYYKLTMSQLAYELEPDAEVTFTLHNRGGDRFLDYVDPTQLQTQFDALRARGWTETELDGFRKLQFFDGRPILTEEYIGYLRANPLPVVEIKHDEAVDDLAIDVTGPWALSTFWETVVMGRLKATYYENYMRANNIDQRDVWAEGDRRLSEKIAILQQHPEIKIADFGTRRHFSFAWQRHVLERLLEECPGNIAGTSNVALARELGIKPIGTFAHELPMVYAGLAQARGRDVRSSHNQLLRDWFDRYGEEYSIALTDTFTTEFFFSDFTEEQARAWRGVRQDSGDPHDFGERLIRFYEGYGIDPRTKLDVFSNSLNIHEIVGLSERFLGRTALFFGWGGGLMSDINLPSLNFVMKATHVRDTLSGQEADTVKLSDDPGKHTGPPELVKVYQDQYFNRQN